MGSLVTAWLVGEAIMVYRSVTKDHFPPRPGDLLAISGLFVLLSLLAEADAHLASLLGWGVDAAAVIHLLSTGGLSSSAKADTSGIAPSIPGAQTGREGGSHG